MGKRAKDVEAKAMEELQYLFWKLNVQNVKGKDKAPEWGPVELFLKQAIKQKLLFVEGSAKKDHNLEVEPVKPTSSEQKKKKVDPCKRICLVARDPVWTKDLQLLNMKKFKLAAISKTPGAWFHSYKRYLFSDTIVGIVPPNKWSTEKIVEVMKSVSEIVQDLLVIVPIEREDKEGLLLKLREQLIEADLGGGAADASETINHFFKAAENNHDPSITLHTDHQLLDSDKEEEEVPIETDGDETATISIPKPKYLSEKVLAPIDNNTEKQRKQANDKSGDKDKTPKVQTRSSTKTNVEAPSTNKENHSPGCVIL